MRYQFFTEPFPKNTEGGQEQVIEKMLSWQSPWSREVLGIELGLLWVYIIKMVPKNTLIN